MIHHVRRLGVLGAVLAICGCGGDGGGGAPPAGDPIAFRKARGFDGIVNALAAGPGGSVYAGGSFAVHDDRSRRNLSRAKADGSPDAAFDVGAGFDHTVNALATAIDGSGDLYVGGRFTTYDGAGCGRVARLNADGSIDPGFDVGGGFDNDVLALTAATDGSGDVYVGGEFSAFDGTPCSTIVRLNPDGSIDPGFSVGSGPDGAVGALAISMDGSGDVTVGGGFASFDGASSPRIVRLAPDGSRNADFAVGAGFDGDVTALAMAADGTGDLHVGGTFTSYDGTGCAGIARLDPDGGLDPGFDSGIGFDDAILTLAPALDGSGDLYAGGRFTSYDGTGCDAIARLNPDGVIDAAFAAAEGFASEVWALSPVPDASGDVYVGGFFRFYAGKGCNRLARLDPDGSIDAGFGVGAGFSAPVLDVAAAPDGSGDVYVTGQFTRYNGREINRIARLNEDGTIDAAFDVGAGFDSQATALAVTADGSGDLYVGGPFTAYDGTGCNGIVRLDSDGSIDPAFDIGSGFVGTVACLALAKDGSGDLYVGGLFVSYDGTACNRIVRLNADGSIDPGFDIGSGFDSIVRSLAPADDGSVVVGGSFTSYDGTGSNRIVRLHPDGSIDPGFDIGAGFNGAVFVVAPVPDGSGDLLVGGFFTDYRTAASRSLVRLNSDGSVDSGFFVGSAFDGGVGALMLLNDGSGDIYVGGNFLHFQAASASKLIRLNPDGSLDGAFDVGTGCDLQVVALAAAPDGSGDLYVAGLFDTYNDTLVDRFIRLTPDGGIR